MKVIKHGKNYIRYGKCDCGCEFEYNRKDTKACKSVLTDAPYPVGVRWFEEKKVVKKELKDKDIIFYVTCPECGNRVDVDREI